MKNKDKIIRHMNINNSFITYKNNLYKELKQLLKITIKFGPIRGRESMILNLHISKKDNFSNINIRVEIWKIMKNEEPQYLEDGVCLCTDEKNTIYFNQDEMDAIFYIVRDYYFEILKDLISARNKNYK